MGRRSRPVLTFRRQLIEIAVFAGTDKAFGGGLQVIPPEPDAFRFLLTDGSVTGGRGDGFQEIGELLDDGIGGRSDVAVAFVDHFGIFHEEPAGLLAKPLDDAAVPGQPDQFRGAVEWVFAAAALAFLLGRLGPFVNKREGDAEFAGNLFGTGLLEGVAEDFV